MGIKCKMIRYKERDYVSVIVRIYFYFHDITFQSFFLQRMMEANFGEGFDTTFMLTVFLVSLVSLINYPLMSAVIVKSSLSLSFSFSFSSSFLCFQKKTKKRRLKVSQEQERLNERKVLRIKR